VSEGAELRTPLEYKNAFDNSLSHIGLPEPPTWDGEEFDPVQVQAQNLLHLKRLQMELDKGTGFGKLKSLIRQSRYLWRTSPPMTAKELDRATHKLCWFIRAGYKLGREISDLIEHPSLSMVGFFTTVTPNEMAMSDAEFKALWTDKSAVAHLKERVNKGLDLEHGKPKGRAKLATKKLICQKCDETFTAYRRSAKYCPRCTGRKDPSKRYCALGTKCLQSVRNIPKVALSGKQYCSDTCQGAAQAARQRAMNQVDRLVGKKIPL